MKTKTKVCSWSSLQRGGIDSGLLLPCVLMIIMGGFFTTDVFKKVDPRQRRIETLTEEYLNIQGDIVVTLVDSSRDQSGKKEKYDLAEKALTSLTSAINETPREFIPNKTLKVFGNRNK